MEMKGWHFTILAIFVFLLDFLTLGNRNVIDNPITNKIAFIIGLLCVFAFLYGIIKARRDFFKNKENRETGTKEEKKWQPINIILGLLIIGFVFYFCKSQPLFVILLRLIPGLVLILTRKNNIFSFLALFIIGLSVFFIITPDGFLILGSAAYMFVSTILRMFKVKKHVLIALALVLILALGLFWEYKTTFVSEDNLPIGREINNKINIELVDDTGQATTTFYFNRGITPIGKGLPRGTYVYQVVSEFKGRVVPLDKWPIFKVKANGDVVQRGMVINWLDLKNVALHGSFNRDGWFPLSLGDYTIQLIKIEKNKRTIVAENNFSIVPYSQQILSKLTAYLTVDGDSNKYYGTYTKKGNDSVTVWVQSPKGEVISGMVKYFMTDTEGNIDKTSWIGVGEDAFRTNIYGEPVPLRNLSGNPPPGIYHYQIIVDGKVIFDLKYDCSF